MLQTRVHKVYLSFDRGADGWRAAQVHNMSAFDSSDLPSDREWHACAGDGDDAVDRWVRRQLRDRSCVVVLIGAATASDPCVRREITYGWNAGLGVVGIHVHGLSDAEGDQSRKGRTPFGCLELGDRPLSSVVRTYTPAGSTSAQVFRSIESNIESWIEEAIHIRKTT